jgi:hypothetical protein
VNTAIGNLIAQSGVDQLLLLNGPQARKYFTYYGNVVSITLATNYKFTTLKMGFYQRFNCMLIHYFKFLCLSRPEQGAEKAAF